MERFLWRFIAGHLFVPARFTAEGTEMRVVAFANHKGGAGETATTINLPAALARAGHRVIPTDLDPQAGAVRGLGVQDSRTVLSTLQGDPALAGVILPRVIQFCEFTNRALCTRGFIPSTIHGRFNLTRAMLALLLQAEPSFRSTVRVSEAPGTEEAPSRHAYRHPSRGDYRLPAVDGEASPSSSGSDALPQKAEPRPSTPGTIWSDA